MTSRAFEIGCILPQQRIELRSKWLDFARLRLRYRLRSTCPYLGNRTTQAFQRTQAEAHLQKHRSDQSDGKHRERDGERRHRRTQRAEYRIGVAPKQQSSRSRRCAQLS